MRREERWISELLVLAVTNLEIDKQVLRLDVTVDHLLSVTVVKCISQLGHILGKERGRMCVCVCVCERERVM